MAEYLAEPSSDRVLLSEIVFEDYASSSWPHSREERAYIDETSFTTTRRVFNGFGGGWKTISESETGYFGIAQYTNPADRLTRVTLPAPCVDSKCSNLLGATEPAATETRQDALRREVQVTTPGGRSLTIYRSEARAQPAGPAGATRFDAALSMNAKGDLIHRLMDGRRIVWVDECTDGIDEPSSVTSLEEETCGAANSSFSAFEATGEVAAIYDAVAVAGPVTQIEDPKHVLRFAYDRRGLRVETIDPDAGRSQNEIDALGRAVSVWNAHGEETVIQFDAIDRPTAVIRPGVEQDETIEYQSALQRRSVSSASFSQTLEYDDLGRLSQKVLTVNGVAAKTMVVDFEYDLLGREVLIVYPDEETVVRYEYAGAYLKRVCEVPDTSHYCNDPSAISYVDDITYDELGRRETVGTPVGTRTLSYTDDNRLKADSFAGSGSSYSRSLAYDAYDELGNVLTLSASSSSGAVDFSASYEYDSRNRLHSWTPGNEAPRYYDYDALGNMVSHGASAPGTQNQFFNDVLRPHAISARTSPNRLYKYDADGNLDYVVGPDGNAHYTFDAASRLVCVGSSEGACDSLRTDYDSAGTRIRDRIPAAGLLVERFYLDDIFRLHVGNDGNSHWGEMRIFALGEEIAFKRVDPVVLRTAGLSFGGRAIDTPDPETVVLAVFGLGVLALLLALPRPGTEGAAGSRRPATSAVAVASIGALIFLPNPAVAGGGGVSEGRRWILSDHLGSGTVVLLSDGVPEHEVVFEPFGGIHTQVGQDGNATIFAGHRREKSTGLNFMQARWQDPETGSFLSVDPLLQPNDPQTLNAYAYARNNPVSFTDPTGMCTERGVASWGCMDPQVAQALGVSSGFFNPRTAFSDEENAAHLAFVEGDSVELSVVYDVYASQDGGTEDREGEAGGSSSQGTQYADAGNVATDAQIVGPDGSPLSQAVDAVLQDAAIPDEVFDQLSLRDVFGIADVRVGRATEQAGGDILRQENARVLGRNLKLARGSILLAFGAPAFEGGMLAAGRVGRTFGELSAKALEAGVYATTPSASGFSPGLLRNGLSLVRGVAQPGLP